MSALSDELKQRLDELVRSKKVVVFMKGSALFPACGFSASAIATLKAAGLRSEDLATVDVLREPAIRQGIKDYSGWPTIPQVFIDGRLVGGSDIVKEMHAKNELAPLLK